MDLDALLGASKGAGWCSTATRTTRSPPRSTGQEHPGLHAALLKASPDTTMLVDEAYFEYATMPGYETMIPLAVDNPRVVVARTFSKATAWRACAWATPSDTRTPSRRWRLGRQRQRQRAGAPGRHGRATQVPIMGEGRAEAQHRGARNFTAEVVRGSRLHAHRFADQLPVRGHQAARPRVPRGLRSSTACWSAATSRRTRSPTAASPSARWRTCRRPCRSSRRSWRSRPRPPRKRRLQWFPQAHDTQPGVRFRPPPVFGPGTETRFSFFHGRTAMDIDRRAFLASSADWRW
jgi:hypothetical protein